MTVNSIDFQVSNLQAIRAQNAFQKSVKANEQQKDLFQDFDKDDVIVSISSKNLNETSSVTNQKSNPETLMPQNKYITDIKEFANKYNIKDFEDDDIKTALKYGTSLFVDQLA